MAKEILEISPSHEHSWSNGEGITYTVLIQNPDRYTGLTSVKIVKESELDGNHTSVFYLDPEQLGNLAFFLTCTASAIRSKIYPNTPDVPWSDRGIRMDPEWKKVYGEE